jgi:putative tryptophan/tyrosine transport system substrate-binding protein
VLARLGELGYVEGKNLRLEYRSADGAIDRFPGLARELIAAKCDLIFAAGSMYPAQALRDATASIPIVIVAIDYDPVKAGIVANLRRPGRNITGGRAIDS